MGLDDPWALRDVFYLLFGIASLVSIGYTIHQSQKRSNTGEAETITRLDVNVASILKDVSEIKVDARSTNKQQSMQGASIAVLDVKMIELCSRVESLEKGSEK